MAASRLDAFIEIESAPQLTPPPPSFRKDNDGIAVVPSDIELNKIPYDRHGETQPERSVDSVLRSSIPVEREHDGLPESQGPAFTEVVPTLSSPPKNRWRFFSCCGMFFGSGVNDSAPGALLPYMERDYHIGYAMISLIFVSNALGFISAAPCVHALESRFGRSRTYMFSMILQAVAYAAMISNPPFPVIVVSFFVLGFANATNLALSTVFIANLANATTYLGIGHGSYGIGGSIAPLIATALVSRGVGWSLFYSFSITFSVLNLVAAGWTFKGYEQESQGQMLALQSTASRNDDARKKSMLKNILQSKVTWIGALFIFAYQGAEVSISGWVISFLISYRDGNPANVGYVTSGFWAGITFGRFFLSHPAHRIGEKLAVYILVVGAIAFQLLSWLIPNIVGEAIAVSILGFLLGPVCPCAYMVVTRLLPRKIQTSCLGIISAMGSSGGAIAPFVTGLLAQKFSTVVLHPICLVLYVVMIVSWACLPKIVKRSD